MQTPIDNVKFAIQRSFRRSRVRRYWSPRVLRFHAVSSLATYEWGSVWSVSQGNHAVPALLMVLLFASASLANEQLSSQEPLASWTNNRESLQFDDWQLRCTSQPQSSESDKPSAPACEIGQPLMVDVDGKPVELLSLAVARASDKAGDANWAMVV